MRFARNLGLLLMALLTSTVGAAASTVTWEGLVSANSSIELVLAGTLAADSTYIAEANINPVVPGSNCFYSGCGLPGTYFTFWHVSTSVAVNGNSFAVANQNCSSPSSCSAEPPFGGFTSGPTDPIFLISVGSILADLCSTTYSDGTSQSCVGAKSGNVDLTLTLLDAAGQLVLMTPIPPTVSLFAAGLMILAAFRRRKATRA